MDVRVRSRYEPHEGKLITLRRLGVPYPEGEEHRAVDQLRHQAHEVAERLQAAGLQVAEDKEIIALIAYLQRLGTDIKPKATANAAAGSAPSAREGSEMYKEALRSIVGIEIFPVISLLLFVAVFAGVLVWAIRADRDALDRHALLPLDGRRARRPAAQNGRRTAMSRDPHARRVRS